LSDDLHCDGAAEQHPSHRRGGDRAPEHPVVPGIAGSGGELFAPEAIENRTVAEPASAPAPKEGPDERADPPTLKPRALDADLCRVIQVWPALPPLARHAILAMIDAATPS
jgi:hypothetical protein